MTSHPGFEPELLQRLGPSKQQVQRKKFNEPNLAGNTIIEELQDEPKNQDRPLGYNPHGDDWIPPEEVPDANT